MTDQRHAHSLPLLQAAKILAQAGRPGSAAALRQGLLNERLVMALEGRSPGGQYRSDVPVSSALRVATILDEFSSNSFDSSFQAIHLLPETWRAQFEEARPQVFLCESAWSGRDSRLRPWKGRIYASENFKHENRGILLEILAYCRANGIPTLFWNKEDPTHYTDRVHDFVKTATEFDHVFTSAVECVPLYASQYGLKSVHALPFATNPALFNPIEQSPRSNAVTFAGSWYANHAERCEDMHHILRGLMKSGYGLEIYDRYYGGADPAHIWPEEYAPLLHPAVPHDRIAEIYKRGRFSLNINTVTGSRTMFARRVFELMSSNTLVLSNGSLGMKEMFGQDVIVCDLEAERLAALTSGEIDAMRERNLNLVLSKHTYQHRWEEMLTAIGFKFHSAKEAITTVWPVRRPEDAMAGVNWFLREADQSRDKLLLIALDELPALEVAALYKKHNRFNIGVTSLRHAEDLAIEGRYAPLGTGHVALIHPDDLPGRGWLARARHHLQYAGEWIIVPASDIQPAYRMVQNADKTLLAHISTLSQWLGSGPASCPIYSV